MHAMTLSTPVAAVVPPAPSPVARQRSAFWIHQLINFVLFAGSTGTLAVAASLEPSPQGYGTHTQLGLHVCGFLQSTGIPCVTCGYTTSFALAAHGHILQSLLNQPAAGALAILTAMTAVVSGYALLRGLSLRPLLYALFSPWPVLAASAVVLAAWVYKLVLVLRMVNP